MTNSDKKPELSELSKTILSMWQILINTNMKEGNELKLIQHLLLFKNTAYALMCGHPELKDHSAVTAEMIEYLNTYLKNHPADMDDFNYEYRTTICMSFCDIFAACSTANGFEHELFVRLSLEYYSNNK